METVIDVVNKVKLELMEAENTDGLCYYACNNVCYDLDKLGIYAEMFNIREMAEVDYDHYFILTKENDKTKNILIDLTFSQFRKQDNSELRFFDSWPLEELENSNQGKALANNLLNQGFSFIDNDDFYLYLRSFNPNLECFFTLDDIISFKTR